MVTDRLEGPPNTARRPGAGGGAVSRRGDRDRWDRLQAKSLDQQFISEMREGLNCSPIEARAIAEKVHEIYGPLFEASAHPQPGQIQLVVVDASVAPN